MWLQGPQRRKSRFYIALDQFSLIIESLEELFEALHDNFKRIETRLTMAMFARNFESLSCIADDRQLDKTECSYGDGRPSNKFAANELEWGTCASHSKVKPRSHNPLQASL